MCSRINQSPASLGPVSNGEGADGERPQAAGLRQYEFASHRSAGCSPRSELRRPLPSYRAAAFTLGPQVADSGFSLPV